MKRLLARRSRAAPLPATASTIVAILGMHRSGTSWLTGSLQLLGLELGDVNTQAKFNAKGNRENESIRVIHENVLQKSGGSWRKPVSPDRWPKKEQRQLAQHIEAMSSRYPKWGFKDPRTLFLLEEWRRQVPELIRVGIYRHPLAVYRSLASRHATFTQQEAVALWREYNIKLIEDHELKPFPVMRFDVPPETLRTHVGVIVDRLQLDGRDRSEAFFDAQLVHNNEAAREAVPHEAVDIWEQLERISLTS